MNLVQVQDRLKELPSGPQTMQLLASYANGANPEVPPFVAMTELMRRKKIAESAPAAQMPQGTIKDKLAQDAGIAAMQQQMAQRQAQAPVNPAAIGIATAPMPSGALNFAPGGIVAFARGSDEDGVDEDENDEADDTDTEDGDGGGGEENLPPMTPAATTTAQKLAELENRIKARESAPAPSVESPLAMQDRLAAANPEMYGMLNTPVGKQYLERMKAVQEKQAAEDAQQQKDIEANRRLDFFKSLIGAGEATRGQKGIGALLGGFGATAIPLEEQRMQQLADIRQRGIKRDELMNTAQFEIDKLQRAQAEGDVKAEHAHMAKVAEIAAKLGVSVNSLLSKQYAGLAGLRQKELGAQAQVEAARLRAAATEQAARIRAAAIANRPEKATDFDKMVKAQLAAAAANGNDPNDPNVQLAAHKNAAYELGRQASTIGAEASRQEKVNREVQNRLLLGSEGKKLRELRSKGDAAGVAALEAEVRRKVEQEFGVGASPAPAAPAAPGTGRKPLSDFAGR